MEDLQKALAKETAAPQSLRPARRRGRWTLLMVADHGRVVTIRWFKWILTAWVLVLVLAAAAGAYLYTLYLHARTANAQLQRSLESIQAQLAGLRTDKEVLMARLVVAQTQLKNLRQGIEFKAVVQTAEEPPESAAGRSAGPDNTASRQSEEAVRGAEEGTQRTASPAGSAERERDTKVAVEDFKLVHDPSRNIFRVHYVLRNSGTDSGQVSGHTAVILKKQNTLPDQWLTLPALQLAAGVPTGSKPGQYFSITRFKPVRFTVKSEMDPAWFDTATVFVFDTEGNLLLAKDVALNL